MGSEVRNPEFLPELVESIPDVSGRGFYIGHHIPPVLALKATRVALQPFDGIVKSLQGVLHT